MTRGDTHTFSSLLLQFIVATIITSAFSTSHFRALKNRKSNPSGLSHFTIPQKASLNSAGVWFANAALKSAVWPYLSSLVSTLIAISCTRDSFFSVSFSGRLLRPRKRPNDFLLFLRESGDNEIAESGSSSTVSAAGVVGVAGGGEVDSESAGLLTPKTLRVTSQSSFNFASSSVVRFPGRPGSVLAEDISCERVSGSFSRGGRRICGVGSFEEGHKLKAEDGVPAGSVGGFLFISSTALGPTKARAEKAMTAAGAMESTAKARSDRWFAWVERGELAEEKEEKDRRRFSCDDLLLLRRSDERATALDIYT